MPASRGSLQRRLLRVPLPQKILYANSAIVILGAIAGTVITIWHVRTFPNDIHYELIALFVVAGVLLSVLINGWVLKQALVPLDRLQDAVDRVSTGQPGVRVTLGAISDERFDRLAATFNSMLDRLEQDASELQQLSRRLIGAQEAERLRLARELHDEAAQGLTSLLVRLRLAQRRVQELREITASALEDVRRVALDLRPTILDDLGLASALEWRVDEFNKESTVQSTVEVRGMESRLPREIELALYRVGQEALSNVHRHAAATEVALRIVRTEEQVMLEVRDNGRGFSPQQQAHFDPESALPDHGIGLLGMRERVAAIGGELIILSAPGQGTTIRALAPTRTGASTESATSLQSGVANTHGAPAVNGAPAANGAPATHDARTAALPASSPLQGERA
jgi:two-component system sensor histidine kinase UhpB